MTFDEWWTTLDTWEQNRRIKEDAKEAYEAGKLEAAQHILKMWNGQMAHKTCFQTRLIVYVDELK